MSLQVVEKCLITTGQKYNLSVQQTSNVLIKYVNNDYKKKILKIKDKYQKLLEDKTISTILNGELDRDIVKAMLMKLDEDEVRMMCQINDYMKNKICIESFWILYFENKFKDKTELFLHLLESDQTERIALIIYKKNKKDIDVNVKDKEAIVLTSRYGHPEVVKELLKDPRVDPSDLNNKAIRLASLFGRLDVVNELLKDERVDPSAWNNNAIVSASEYGHLDVVKELLKDKRVDPSARDNDAIYWASRNGHLDVVKELLKDERVDTSASDNYAIRWASRNGHFDVVKELLKDPRVDPSNRDNYAIRLASKNGHLNVVRELLKDERVKNSLSDDEIKKYQKMLK